MDQELIQLEIEDNGDRMLALVNHGIGIEDDWEIVETVAPPSTPTSDCEELTFNAEDRRTVRPCLSIMDQLDDLLLDDPACGNGDPDIFNIDRWCSILDRDCRGRILMPANLLNPFDRITKNMIKFHLFVKGYFLQLSDIIGETSIDDFYANLSAIMVVSYIFPADIVVEHQGFVRRSHFFKSVRKCLVPIMSRYSSMFHNAQKLIDRNPCATVAIVSQFFDKYLFRRNSITQSMHREALSCLVWGVVVLCVGTTGNQAFYRRIEYELMHNSSMLIMSRGSKRKLEDILTRFRKRLGPISMRNIDSMIRLIRRSFPEKVIDSKLFVQTIQFSKFPEVFELQFILKGMAEYSELRWNALCRFFPHQNIAFHRALFEMNERDHIALASAELSPAINRRHYRQFYLVVCYTRLASKMTEMTEEIMDVLRQIDPKAKMIADEYLHTDDIAMARRGILNMAVSHQQLGIMLNLKKAYEFPQFLEQSPIIEEDEY